MKKTVQILRHGLKGPGGNLDSKHPDGVTKAIKFGQELEAKDLIFGFHSAIARAMQTTEQILKHAPHIKNLGSQELTELRIPPFSKQKTLEYKAIAKDPQQDAAIWYSSFGDTRPDPETFSPLETAERIAYAFYVALEKINTFDAELSIDAILGTHGAVPELLLQRVLIVNNRTGIECLSELGGGLKLVEPIVFNISDGTEIQPTLTCDFRNQSYPVDTDLLQYLNTQYRKKNPTK